MMRMKRFESMMIRDTYIHQLQIYCNSNAEPPRQPLIHPVGRIGLEEEDFERWSTAWSQRAKWKRKRWS